MNPSIGEVSLLRSSCGYQYQYSSKAYAEADFLFISMMNY